MTPPESKTQLLARDVMQTKVITVNPEMTLWDAGTLFHERKITGAPVVDKNDKLVGVVSQSDLVRHRHRAAVSAYFNPEQAAAALPVPDSLKAEDNKQVWKVMNPVVFTANEDAPLRDVVRLMVKGRIHRIIIVRDGKLSGIITTMDITRRLHEWYGRSPDRDLSD